MADTDLTPDERRVIMLEQELESQTRLLRFYERKEFEEKLKMLRTMTNGDWRRIVSKHPDIMDFIERAKTYVEENGQDS